MVAMLEALIESLKSLSRMVFHVSPGRDTPGQRSLNVIARPMSRRYANFEMIVVVLCALLSQLAVTSLVMTINEIDSQILKFSYSELAKLTAGIHVRYHKSLPSIRLAKKHYILS